MQLRPLLQLRLLSSQELPPQPRNIRGKLLQVLSCFEVVRPAAFRAARNGSHGLTDGNTASLPQAHAAPFISHAAGSGTVLPKAGLACHELEALGRHTTATAAALVAPATRILSAHFQQPQSMPGMS